MAVAELVVQRSDYLEQQVVESQDFILEVIHQRR
jgi:hypothetical protein